MHKFHQWAFSSILGTLLLACVAGCNTPCIVIYDVETGKKTGKVPMQPDFTREMILRIEPDGKHFLTVSEYDSHWHLRTYDMNGRKVKEVEIQGCADEYYSAIVSNRVTASVDIPKVLSMGYKKNPCLCPFPDTNEGYLARQKHIPYCRHTKDLFSLISVDIVSGKTQIVPLSEKHFPLPSDAYERLNWCIFTHYQGGVWAGFIEWPKNRSIDPPVGPYYHVLCHVAADGTVTPVFRCEGYPFVSPARINAASRDGSVLAYVLSDSKLNDLIRIVHPLKTKIVREINCRDVGLRGVSDIAFGVEGDNLFISGGILDNNIHKLLQYNVETGAWKELLSGSRVYDIVPTGGTHLSVYHDGNYEVIDLTTGRIVRTIKGCILNYLHATPDGRYVIVQCN